MEEINNYYKPNNQNTFKQVQFNDIIEQQDATKKISLVLLGIS